MNSKNDLQKRWKTVEGQKQVNSVLRLLESKTTDLSSIGIAKIDDRFDLRGIQVRHGNSRSLIGLAFGVLRDAFLKNIYFSNVDLSFSTFDNIAFDNCHFEKVLLDRASLTSSKHYGCTFSRVIFSRSNLKNSFLGGSNGNTTTDFIDCVFTESNMTSSSHGAASYKQCQFNQNNLNETNFDGARLEDCKFIGRMESVEFRRFAQSVPKDQLPWKGECPDKYQNKMKNIDFSDASFENVNFNGVDLSSCKFPGDSICLVINNQYNTFVYFIDYLNSHWLKSNKSIILNQLEALYVDPDKLPGVYLTVDKMKQPIQIVSRLDFIDFMGPTDGEELYSMLRDFIFSRQRLATKTMSPTPPTT